MQKRNKTKKAIKVQDLKPKKDAKGGVTFNIGTHNPGRNNPRPLNPKNT
jgi:hypothetical protein